MKRIILPVALVTALYSTTTIAGNNWEKDSMDAWIDGKAEATILFNGNLDSFDINTDVKDGIVTLSGSVENSIERELAEELILGIDGVNDVENRLTVINQDMNTNSEVASNFKDAKISTVITSRLLFESEVSGTAIDVDVDDRVVTLNGKLDSEAERDLAITIAENTTDVKSVKNNITIDAE